MGIFRPRKPSNIGSQFKKMKKLFSLVFAVLSCVAVQSQTRNCGTMEHLEFLKSQDPMLEERMQKSKLDNYDNFLFIKKE